MSNKLRDGVVGSFLVTAMGQKEVEVEVNDGMGRITKQNMTRFELTLTHDASAPGFTKDDLATDYDPSAPLKMPVVSYLDAAGGDVEKCPKSDRMRWAFQKFPNFNAILDRAGYDYNADENKFPLPRPVFVKVALAGVDNYIKAIGGPELAEENKAAQGKLNNVLKARKASAGTEVKPAVNPLKGRAAGKPTETVPR